MPPDRSHIDIVAHRGPDGAGWNVFETGCGPLALGHRRLAIIDLSEAGHQPMAYDEGRFWLVFNGEIYNYLELRRELEAAGRHFHTATDSEVLVAAYAQWGESALDRFVGMFAFVIWDAGKQRLFAARDRFGIKPLYWCRGRRGIAFASEIKQLLSIDGISRRMNVPRVRDFLVSGISDHTGETMFEDVRQLRGGESVTIDLACWRAGDVVPIRRWYNILRADSPSISEKEAAEQFRALLVASVRMHLRSDVAIGSCLSGGLDSSSIVCIMDGLLKQGSYDSDIKTISACYAEKEVDERQFMEAVVSSTRSQPYYIYPKSDDVFANAENLTWHQDEPYGSTSIFAQSNVFAAAKAAGVKVMLDGQGADEQLAGYHGGFHYYIADLVRRGQVASLLKTIFQRQRFHGVAAIDQLKSILLPLLPTNLTQLLKRQQKSIRGPDWTSSDVFRSLADQPSAFETALAGVKLGSVQTIGELCVAMTQGSNLTMLLHWEDRNSMAHGIEARVPFLDHRLVEFSIGLGDQHKIVLGDTKRVLRQAMVDILPTAVRERRDKLGFATPEQVWFRGPLREAVETGVEETLAIFPDLLNLHGVRQLVGEMLDGKRAIDFTLWRIINVGIWGRVFGVTIH